MAHPHDSAGSADRAGQAGPIGSADSAEARSRAVLTAMLNVVQPFDEQEIAHLAEVSAWITAGAPLYRTRKPDLPPMHLVSYFVVLDATLEKLLLVAHRKAGLWLPAGGHVEPLEHPWQCVVRECLEELRIEAVPSGLTGERPFFVTVTETRGAGRHTDVSLWFLLRADAESITWFDHDEFDAIAWLSLADVLARPADQLDPHMHRFTRKLRATAPVTRATHHPDR